jgi:hypothetical protein
MVKSINGSTPHIEANYGLCASRESIAAEFGGDAAAELAAMVFVFSRERSKDAAENRNALENAVQAHQARQVELMHDAADAKFNGALIKGATQAIGGLVSLGGDSAYIKATGEGVASLGTLGSGYFEKQATNREANAQAKGNRAETGIRALEQVEQNVSEAQDMKKRTLDFMSAIQETKAEADKALVSIRA